MTTSIEEFGATGFVVVRGAVSPDAVRGCVAVVEDALRARGVDPRNAATWTQPVVRLPCPDSAAFTAAGTSPALWRLYDSLLGPAAG
jgi:hypothetical protein